MDDSQGASRTDGQILTLTISFRGHSEVVSLSSSSTLGELQETLYEKTNVPPALQKLLCKGKKIIFGPEATLEQAGLKDKAKVQMLGSTEQQLEDMMDAENERRRRDDILRARAEKRPPTVRMPRSSLVSTVSYKFHSIVPLPHLPSPANATAYLNRLAADPAVQHVMQKHRFSVHTLTELAPHEQPHLLGLNVNRGEAIRLRIRTDEYDGFRPYLEVRRVLCHELTHNVWGDHDDNFKKLNSQLNKEVSDFERAAREGAHRLGGDVAVYTPLSLDVDSEAHEYILGTAGGQPRETLINTAEERRRHALEAAVSRLRLEEAEVENSCGTAGPQASSEEAAAAVTIRSSPPQKADGSSSAGEPA